MNLFNIFLMESGFMGLDLFELIGLGITTQPRCSSCIFMVAIKLVPAPPLDVPTNAILSENASLQ